MSEFWISHSSVHTWSNEDRWAEFFEESYSIIESPLTHLDISDPVRRRAGSLKQAAEYASQFDDKGGNTWLFGNFADAGINLTIQKISRGKFVYNNLTISTSKNYINGFGQSANKIRLLFHAGRRFLRPFYSFSDDRSYVISRKPKGRSVDISAELVGVFWITYFGESYVNFFGKEKFLEFPDLEADEYGGITIQLSEAPNTIPMTLRAELEAGLGAESFVNPESIIRKPPGRFALSLEEIIDFDNRSSRGLSRRE